MSFVEKFERFFIKLLVVAVGVFGFALIGHWIYSVADIVKVGYAAAWIAGAGLAVGGGWYLADTFFRKGGGVF